MAEQYSSTAQDLQRGKPTEIDALNGFVAQRGAAQGIATPVNRYDFTAPAQSTKPKFLIHGERDEICPLKDVRELYARAAEPKELVVIDAADHLFDGKVSEVGDAIEDLLGDWDR